MLTEKIQREAARRFVADWTGRGYERGESQQFWLQLLTQVFGVDDPAKRIGRPRQVYTGEPERHYVAMHRRERAAAYPGTRVGVPSLDQVTRV